tara:strand:+ start:2482 stop:3114 length:633 start_codon:yes stop_codon:yes gene_type:complete
MNTNIRFCFLAFACLAVLASCAPQEKGRILAPAFTRSADQCILDLASEGIAFTVIPEDVEDYCVVQNQLVLDGSYVAYTGTGQVKGQCEMISALTKWERTVLQPSALKIFGSPVVKVHELSNFSCRRIARTEFRSQHSHGNAIDISGFTLENGRYIDLEDDWGTGTDADRFLHALQRGACGIFSTVLSPDYNWDHRNHFHFDVGAYLSCN